MPATATATVTVSATANVTATATVVSTTKFFCSSLIKVHLHWQDLAAKTHEKMPANATVTMMVTATANLTATATVVSTTKMFCLSLIKVHLHEQIWLQKHMKKSLRLLLQP
jgi:hypothetical protein